MAHDVFISYSSKNIDTALAICHVLEKKNIRCWMAPRNIPAGADYGDIIDEAIVECKVFLLLFSEPATISQWVKGELNLAFSEAKHIIPYRIDQTPLKGAMRVILNQTHWIDAYPDADNEFAELVTNISAVPGLEHVIKESSVKLRDVEGPTMTLKIKPDADCDVYIDDSCVMVAEENTISKIELRRGSYILRCVSLLNPKVYEEKILEIKEVGVDMLQIVTIRERAIESIPHSEYEVFTSNGKCGYKYKGHVAIEAQFDDCWPFREGLARVQNDGKMGFVDKFGVYIIDPIYDIVESFSEGLACVKTKNKWGFITMFGEESIPLIYDEVASFSEGLALVELDGKRGFIGKNGKIVVDIKYDNVWSFNEGRATVLQGNSWGFIDAKGEEVIPLIYEGAWSFSSSYARAKLNGKWGFIDKLGEVIVPFEYDDVWSFNEGVARVGRNRQYGFIDKSGRVVIPLKYDDVYSFHDGYARIIHNRRWGSIDKWGNERWDE